MRLFLPIVLAGLAAAPARAQQSVSLCQGRVCWPPGARPVWLDHAFADFEEPRATTPTLAAGRLVAHARLVTPPGLDARTCTLEESWRGTRRGAHGEREHVAGRAVSATPPQLVPTADGTDALFVVDAPLPGAEVAVETYAGITCGGVHFNLMYATSHVVSTDDVLPLLCALRPPRHTSRDVPVRLPALVRNVRLGVRYGYVLRRRGSVLVDACSGHDLLDLATLALPIADIGVPALGALTEHDRALALWGVTDVGHSAAVVRLFHGFSGEWFGLRLSRQLTPTELARLSAALAAVPALSTVDTMDDAPHG